MKKVNENIIIPIKRIMPSETERERIMAALINKEEIAISLNHFRIIDEKYKPYLYSYLNLFELDENQGFADEFINKYTNFETENQFQSLFIEKILHAPSRHQKKKIEKFFKEYTKFSSIDDMKRYYLG